MVLVIVMMVLLKRLGRVLMMLMADADLVMTSLLQRLL